MTLQERITEILGEHHARVESHPISGHAPRVCCRCHPRTLAHDYPMTRTQHRAHVAALIAEAVEQHYRPVIETVEQLDALPVGAVLADLHCDLTPPPVYVRFIDGWSLDGLKVKPGRQNLAVLWTPGAGE